MALGLCCGPFQPFGEPFARSKNINPLSSKEVFVEALTVHRQHAQHFSPGRARYPAIIGAAKPRHAEDQLFILDQRSHPAPRAWCRFNRPDNAVQRVKYMGVRVRFWQTRGSDGRRPIQSSSRERFPQKRAPAVDQLNCERRHLLSIARAELRLHFIGGDQNGSHGPRMGTAHIAHQQTVIGRQNPHDRALLCMVANPTNDRARLNVHRATLRKFDAFSNSLGAACYRGRMGTPLRQQNLSETALINRIELPIDATGFAPPVGQRVKFRAGDAPKFIVSVDTEEEFDWTRPFNRLETETRTIARMPFLTKRFNEAGVKPVFLCVYPVVEHEASGAIMRRLVEEDRCEIGAHLHPWVTPPYEEVVNIHNSFTGNLAVGLQKAKLRCLTEQIEHCTGVRPVIYRAGRYGIGPSTLSILEEQGYRIDVSIRPLFDYSNEGGPDFRSHPNWAWRSSEGILQVPLTTGRLGVLRRTVNISGNGWSANTLARLGLLTRVPLTPEGIPLAEALEAIRILHGEGQDLFCLSFHSPSAGIGYTPYVRDEADLKAFWKWWAHVISLLLKLGVEPTTYTGLLDTMDLPH
ncbi:MAG: hypothetical protein RIS52_331 [Pseudomonadota bacterium]